MLPLTSTVYVNGTLATKESVLVDIGTGYYIEVSVVSLLSLQRMRASYSPNTAVCAVLGAQRRHISTRRACFSQNLLCRCCM